MEILVCRLGKLGAIFHTFANGQGNTPVQRSDHIPNFKSVGNSATTPRDLETEEDVKLMLYLLAESVCSRMRKLASRCTVLEVSVRDTELRSFTRQKPLLAPFCSSQELAEVGLELFRRHYRWDKQIRSIWLRGAGLVEADGTIQLSLYADDQRRDKWERIDAAVDPAPAVWLYERSAGYRGHRPAAGAHQCERWSHDPSSGLFWRIGHGQAQKTKCSCGRAF